MPRQQRGDAACTPAIQKGLPQRLALVECVGVRISVASA